VPHGEDRRLTPPATSSAVASSSAPVVAPSAPPPVAVAKFLTVTTGNVNGFGKPNAWAYIPSAFAKDKPLRVTFVFHGFSNCLESIVSAEGKICRDATRTGYDLPAQIDRSATSSIVIVPQLAYDEKSGEPGVIDNAPAFEKFTREVLDAMGEPRAPDRVTMVAMSGGYQALYCVLPAFGDKLRDVYMLDAYYAEEGPVDAWLIKNAADFEKRTRKLAVIYSTLDGPRVASQGFAARAVLIAPSTVHNKEPHDITVDDLSASVAFLYSNRDHDDIPKTDIAKVLAASTSF
jgi:hypothetical protein